MSRIFFDVKKRKKKRAKNIDLYFVEIVFRTKLMSRDEKKERKFNFNVVVTQTRKRYKSSHANNQTETPALLPLSTAERWKETNPLSIENARKRNL
jgi:hypothetical protein